MVDHSSSSGEAIRVLIVDDHALFRRGLIQVLQFEDGIEVVGEAEDGEDAIAKSEELAPDVLLMDVRMPRVSGIEATRRLAETMPTMKILMLTVSDEEDDLYEAIKAGATGYLLKEISIEEVADQLYIAENTVKNHVRNILEKLHLHSRMEAVLYAVREKLFELE